MKTKLRHPMFLGLHGAAIIGAILGAFIYSRYKKIELVRFLDIGALGLMIGQSIGRWGNFVNAEAYGGETSLPWRMQIGNGACVHPTFLYESLWNLTGFILINIFYNKRKCKGEVMFWYFSWYGLGRTFIELLRTDSLMLGPFRVSSLLSASLVIVLLPIGIFLRRLCKKYTEEGLLKEGEITTVKMLLYIFYRKKKGLPVRVKSTENHDATASENK